MYTLTQKEFFNYYRPSTLSKNIIIAINDYYQSLEYKKMLKKYDNTKWYPFQQKIIDICTNEPDDRTIYIIEDEGGRNGK